MGRRKTFEVPGVTHGGAPIPMGAMVGNIFHSSAVMGADPQTGALPDDGARQVELVFANVKTLLEAAGLTSDDVVYFNVFLEDVELRGAVNEHWLAWFPEEHDRPARHVTVRPLPGKMLVQLQFLAVAS